MRNFGEGMDQKEFSAARIELGDLEQNYASPNLGQSMQSAAQIEQVPASTEKIPATTEQTNEQIT